jgi:hypothetical protein
MRKLFLLGMMVFSMQSVQAFRMNDRGFDTGYGLVSWESFGSFPQKITALENQVTVLRNTLIFGSVLVAGAFIYMQWSKQAKTEQASDAKLEEKAA